MAALFEAYPNTSGNVSVSTQCRRYFLVTLDARGQLINGQRIQDPLLEACNHPHPYGVVADSVGNLFIAFSPTTSQQAPLVPDKPAEASGVLVPIANPAGMATLVDLALAMQQKNDPPPRLLALVRRPNRSLYAAREASEDAAAPEAGVLSAALDHARARGVVLSGQAVWTDHPPDDIVDVAADPSIRWVLLGFHRPVFGTDVLGGVVRAVFERAGVANVNAAVVIHSHERALSQVVVVIDDCVDGEAALELGCRVAHRDGQTIRLVLVPRVGGEPEHGLQQLVKRASRQAARWLPTQVVDRADTSWLTLLTSGDLVVVGASLVEELHLPITSGPLTDRLLVVVKGGVAPRPVEDLDRREPLPAIGLA